MHTVCIEERLSREKKAQQMFLEVEVQHFAKEGLTPRGDDQISLFPLQILSKIQTCLH